MTASAVVVRDATVDDAARLAELYAYYVDHTVITFETDTVPCEVMGARISKVHDAGRPWLVIEAEGAIQGFAYAAPFRERSAYRHSVETTVYLAHGASRRGWGITLYRALLDRLRDSDVHVAVALIALPNEASVGVHERLGFTHAGTLREVGRKFDQWIDVGYWELRL